MEVTGIMEIVQFWEGTLRETKDINLESQVLRQITIKCHEFFRVKETIKWNTRLIESLINIARTLKISSDNDRTNVDQQILCTTGFFMILQLLPRTDGYHGHLDACNAELNDWNTDLLDRDYLKEGIYSCFKIDTAIKRNKEKRLASRIAGLFQSNILEPCEYDNDLVRKAKWECRNAAFLITYRKCLTYSACTFLHFKNLASIMNKFYEWEIGFIDEEIWIVLYIVFNNWENLVTGVCEWNVQVFHSLIKIITRSRPLMMEKIVDHLMTFPWNKAKYLSLNELVSIYDHVEMGFIEIYPTVLSGLRLSLLRPHLVSYGASLYKTLLKGLDTYDTWSDVFFDLLESILTSDNQCAKKNLLNYWMPNTIKKFPEYIIAVKDILIENDIVIDYFSCMSFLKMCRKTGLLLTNWKSSDKMETSLRNAVNLGLIHLDEEVRAEAFQVVCVTNGLSTPTQDEIYKVRHFLEININDDSTAFRQKNLRSFAEFFLRLHDSYLRLLKKQELSTDIFILGDFLFWLFEFVHENLDGHGNYQRKIMSLQIYKLMLQYLDRYDPSTSESQKFMRKVSRQGQGYNIVQHMRSTNKEFFNVPDMLNVLLDCLKDNTDDVREVAAEIMINHFVNNKEYCLIRQQETFYGAMKLCNSPIFYRSASGCVMFKVLSRSKHRNMLLYGNANNAVQDHLLKETLIQFGYQKRNILISTTRHRPLHGIMSAMNNFVKDSVCTEEFISSIKDLVHSVTDYFIKTMSVKSDADGFPPSFAEMGESIEEIIRLSTSEECADEKLPNLSENHQLVLNNIWLNLKVCCEFSYTMLTKTKNNKDRMEFLDVCIKVLTKCRHKGAIEAAGVCLGHFVKYITTHGDEELNYELSKLFKTMLLEFTSEQSEGGSVSRRGAGLTILVHRIVSNDSKPERPLFQMAMTILLAALSQDDTQPEENTPADAANEKDMPKARALHLLCRTVTESSLSQCILLYASDLAQLCFKHLVSEQWQMRNGALQLFGALVPKLVGQRKNQGDDVAESPVPVDELFCHIPSLWTIVEKTLTDASETSSPITHSNIIPVLSLLASTSKRYSLDIQTDQFAFPLIAIEDILPCIVKLFGSNVWTVRNLAAKVFVNFFKLDIFEEQMEQIGLLKENQLHGFTLAFKYYVNDYFNSKKYVLTAEKRHEYLVNLNNILGLFEITVNQKEQSYLIVSLIAEIQSLLKNDKREHIAVETFNNMNPKKSIGIHALLKTVLTCEIMDCSESELLDLIKMYFIDSQHAELEVLSALRQRLLEEVPDDSGVVKSLFEMIYQTILSKKTGYNKLYEILYLLCESNTFIVTKEIMNDLLSHLNLEKFLKEHSHTYLLPLLCCLSCDEKLTPAVHQVETLSEVCHEFSKPELFDSTTRQLSAISLKYLNVLGTRDPKYRDISKDTYEIQKNIYIATLWLLQDENVEVRKEAAKINLLQGISIIACPTYQWVNILSKKILHSCFKEHTKTLLLDILERFVEMNIDNDQTKETSLNPFNNDSCNVYWEPYRFKLKIGALIKEMKKT